jgi:hypothetical protein
MTRSQDGLTCCDEARADGRSDFVAFMRAVEQDVAAAGRRAQGDAILLSSLVADAFDKFDASSGGRAPLVQLAGAEAADGSRKFKFSTSRATLRVKTTVEVLIKYKIKTSNPLHNPQTLLEEHKEAAAAAAEGRAAAAPAAPPKPKSRIMFSS